MILFLKSPRCYKFNKLTNLEKLTNKIVEHQEDAPDQTQLLQILIPHFLSPPLKAIGTKSWLPCNFFLGVGGVRVGFFLTTKEIQPIYNMTCTTKIFSVYVGRRNGFSLSCFIMRSPGRKNSVA